MRREKKNNSRRRNSRRMGRKCDGGEGNDVINRVNIKVFLVIVLIFTQSFVTQ